MKLLRPMLFLCVAILGCAPPPPPQHRVVVIDPMRPLPLDPAWEQFARESFPARVYSLIEPAANVDFGQGPDAITAAYKPDVGISFLTVSGSVEYDDQRGVRMHAGYFVRWDYPGLTNAADTPWSLRSAAVIDKKPVPPPPTQPATQPAPTTEPTPPQQP
jgi:hypothetical protein